MHFSYPKARRDQSVIDDYHGHKVSDPYRWLEDPDSKETIAFVDAQNAISQPFIEQCSHRQKIHESLTEKWNFAKYSSPAEHGGSYYYYCNSGLQNQSVLYVQDELKSEPRVFLDPNKLSEDGTLSISGTAFSEDGSYFAYGLSKCGSDWITIHFKKAPSGEDLPDTLEHVKFSSMAWTHDNKGMFYNRYPVEGKSDGTETTTNLYNKLYYHVLGTDQKEDILTVQFQKEPKWKMQSTDVSDSYSYANHWQNQHYDSSHSFVMSGIAMAAGNEWQRPIFGACAPPSYLSTPFSFASGGISCSPSHSVKPNTSKKGEKSSEKKKNKTKKKTQESKSKNSVSPDPVIEYQPNYNILNNNIPSNYNNNYAAYCHNYGWTTPMHGYQTNQPCSPTPRGYNQPNYVYSSLNDHTSYGNYYQLNVSNNNPGNYSAADNSTPVNNSTPTQNSTSANVTSCYSYPTNDISNANLIPVGKLSKNNNYTTTKLTNFNQNNNITTNTTTNDNDNNNNSNNNNDFNNNKNYSTLEPPSKYNNNCYYLTMGQPSYTNNSYCSPGQQINPTNPGYNSSYTSPSDITYEQYNNQSHVQYGNVSHVQQNNSTPPVSSGQQQNYGYTATYLPPWQQSTNYCSYDSSSYSGSSVPSNNLSYQSPISNSKTFNTTLSSFYPNQSTSFCPLSGQSQPCYQYSYPGSYSYPYCQYTYSGLASVNAPVNYGQRNETSGIQKSGGKASIPDTIFVPQYRGAEVSECGKYLLLSPNEGCDPVNRLFYVELDKLPNGIVEDLPFVKLIDNFDAQYEYITNEGSVFTFLTNLNAPKYKIINIDFQNPDPKNWKTLVEEDENAVLEWASCVNQNKLVLCYLKDVKNKLYVHQLETGKLESEIPLDIGTIIGCSGRKKSKEIFIHFMSFLTPGIIYRIDMTVDKPTPEVFRVIKVNNFDFSRFEVKQVFYPSKDGTKIPMFLVHKKNLVLNGNTPTFLYGYGGFDISMKPTFSVSRLVFLKDLDGVYALANIRGGGEYGEKWHKSGTHANKQNVFDDFHAAAEYLIKEKYTCSKKLVVHGQSNGGLLIAACINQRPELYGVALAQVGVMDMFRFHKFTIGHAWTTDFGCSDIPEQFEFLKKYSPLHNIRVPKDDTQYPSTLLLTADHDDRVVPLHSLKFIAELQHTMAEQKKQTNPLLIKIDTKAGHGRGKPTAMIIQEQTDMYCFIVKTLGLDWIQS